MAIIKKQSEEKTTISSSKKVGKANSKEIKKRSSIKSVTMTGTALQLDKDDKVVAPTANKKKEQKKISQMVKDAKN